MTKEYPRWEVPHWAVVAARTPWIGMLALLAVVVFGYDAIHYIAVSGFSPESLSSEVGGWCSTPLGFSHCSFAS
jgi:hypothetical protein